MQIKSRFAFTLFFIGTACSLLMSRSSFSDKMPPLSITLPQQGLVASGNKIRFAGRTNPEYKVKLEDKEIKVYSSGAFVGMLDLEVGLNSFKFSAFDSAGNIKGSTDLSLTRKSPSKSTTSSEAKTVFDSSRKGQFVLPKEALLDLYASNSFEKPFAQALKDAPLEIIKESENAVQLKLSNQLTVWAKAKDLKQYSSKNIQSDITKLKSVSIGSSKNKAQITFDADSLKPFAVYEEIENQKITFRFFKTELGDFWRPQFDSDSPVSSYQLIQVADNLLDLEILWRPDFLFTGYQVNPRKDRMELTLNFHLKNDLYTKRLEGLKIILDPGHGGDSPGALGSTGMTEAEANHKITKSLVNKLKLKKAEVLLTTKSPGEYLDLDQRVELAEKSGADLFISIHNDSVSLSSDPLKSRGSTVFFTHPHSKKLAENIYGTLRKIDTDTKGRGYYQRDLRVTRKITSMPSILVECRFMSHPLDEIDLLNTKKIDQLADSILTGILNYISTDSNGNNRP